MGQPNPKNLRNNSNLIFNGFLFLTHKRKSSPCYKLKKQVRVSALNPYALPEYTNTFWDLSAPSLVLKVLKLLVGNRLSNNSENRNPGPYHILSSYKASREDYRASKEVVERHRGDTHQETLKNKLAKHPQMPPFCAYYVC